MLSSYLGTRPRVDRAAWVAHSAEVIGDVHIAEGASVWFQSVVRGDVASIRIGERSNIQDHCTIHVTRDACPTVIHSDVTLGHRVVVHGAEIRAGALIGIGAVVLDKAVIEEGALVAAMSLVTPGTIIPAGKMAMGQPARVVREVSADEREWMRETVINYAGYARDYAGSR